MFSSSSSRHEPHSPALHRPGMLPGIVALLGILAWVSVPAGAAHDQGLRSISVTGEAERRVAPDMAVLQMDVVSESENAAVAREEADKVTGRALELLRDAGISDADIDTTGLRIAPQYRWLKNESRQQLTGYQVTRSIEVRLLELEQLGALVTALSAAGINQIQPPRLGLLDEESIYQEVLAEAAQNARERAAVVAAAVGGSLGEALSISTGPHSMPRPMRAERAMMAADSAPGSAAESYNAGYLDYRISVSASFTLE